MAPLGTRVRELAPHYVAIIALILMVVWTVDMFVDLSQGLRFLLAAAVAILYPFVLRWFGVAPESWS